MVDSYFVHVFLPDGDVTEVMPSFRLARLRGRLYCKDFGDLAEVHLEHVGSGVVEEL